VVSFTLWTLQPVGWKNELAPELAGLWLLKSKPHPPKNEALVVQPVASYFTI